MKTKLFLLSALLTICGQTMAQKVLLPCGKLSQESWSAKYFYAPNDGEKPDANWYKADFDDSAWGDIQGPLALNPTDYWNKWESTYATYWLRRTFDLSNPESYSTIRFKNMNDDEIEVYLNGTLIYSTTKVNTNLATLELNENMRNLLVKGKNTIAVKASDTHGGDSFVDFGLYAYDTPDLTNAEFNSSLTGWTCTGLGLKHGGQSFNYLVQNLGTSPFDIHQTVTDAKKGLYRVKIQAFEGTEKDLSYVAWQDYKSGKPSKAYAYIGDTRHAIKNVFDESVETNIYRNNEFFITSYKTYVPTYISSTSIAFDKAMYENEFYAYMDATTFDIGVCMAEEAEYKKWQCFDNFRLDYINAMELEELKADIVSTSAMAMEAGLKKELEALAKQIKANTDNEAVGRAIANKSDVYTMACKSAASYGQLLIAMNALQGRIDTGTNMTASALTEAKEMLAETRKHYAGGTANDLEIKEYISKLNTLESRLNYNYVSVNVTVPGTLGDCILEKTENFVDVISLKIAGTLNSDDIYNIQKRLTNLKEIDMTDVKMTDLPSRLFYKRTELTEVKLPSTLKTIGKEAFYNCEGLKNIDFPSTLTTISEYAFSDCYNLQQIILPEGLTTLGNGAFYSCDYNKYIKLPSTLTSVSERCFMYNLYLEQIDFAEGLTHINNEAFSNCRMLNNLHFPKSLYYIGKNSFDYNYALKDIKFNEGLYKIADNAFRYCYALKEVTLPSSLVLANESPFDYCDNLRKVTCLSLEPPYMTDQIPLFCSMADRELYVPKISVSLYKQTEGWEMFPTIKPIDYLPENMNILSNFKLTLPENIPADYKPNVSIIGERKDYDLYFGSLTVNGEGTLSMGTFSTLWDVNDYYINPEATQYFCSLVNDSHLRADKVDVVSYLKNDEWTFFSFPFNVKMSDIEATSAGTTHWVVRRYDGAKRAAGSTSDTWVRLGSNDMLEAGKGYIIQACRYEDSYRTYFSKFIIHALNDSHKNDIFKSSDVVVKLDNHESEFAHNRSWNFIGNPYPCYYDTRFMDFEAPITIWNMLDNTYTAYSPVDDSYVLCPGEAFFVQRPVDSESITFSKEGRQTNRTARTLEMAKTRSAGVGNTRTVINLTLTDGNSTDRTRLVVNEAATMEYDMNRDANKFFSLDPTAPQFYSVGGDIEYAINERPFDDGKFALSALTPAEGIYTIALDGDVDEYEVVLVDDRNGKRTVLNGESYTFNVEGGTKLCQFTIILQAKTSTGVDATVADAEKLAGEKLYTIDGKKVETPTRSGLYIQDNKKVILK